MAGDPILNEVGGVVLGHEELQLVFQDLAIPHTIHRLPRLKKPQSAPPPPAEAGPSHDLGQVLDTLPGKFRVKHVRPLALLQRQSWLPISARNGSHH